MTTTSLEVWSVLRNLERAGGVLALRLRLWEPERSVQGTEVQGVALRASYAVLRAGNRHIGPLWQTAVATPVCDGRCPAQTSLHSCRRARGRHRRSPDRCSRVAQVTAERGIECLRS